jgi:hypothetical protein
MVPHAQMTLKVVILVRVQMDILEKIAKHVNKNEKLNF